MYTIEPYDTSKLPSNIKKKEPNGVVSHFTLRCKSGSGCAYPYILEYYEQSPATDEETIAFQGFGNTEEEAIADMTKKLKAVGLKW